MGQLFKKRANSIARAVVIGLPLLLAGSAWSLYAFARSSFTTGVAAPLHQPVPFSHQHHVGGLGIDCRYCHISVEKSAFAGMPSTATCMTCHSQLWTQAPILATVRESLATDLPIRRTRVHQLADYVYF